MCHSLRENIVYPHRIPELPAADMGTARSHDFNGETARLPPNQLAGPTPRAAPTQNGHKLWGLRHLPLQPSLAEKAIYLCLVTQRTGRQKKTGEDLRTH